MPFSFLNTALLADLAAALTEAASDPEVRVVCLAGEGGHFAAGADITEMAGASAVEMFRSKFIPQFDRIRAIRKPVIAAVSGWCLGGGNELAMACDLIIASEESRFVTHFVVLERARAVALVDDRTPRPLQRADRAIGVEADDQPVAVQDVRL